MSGVGWWRTHRFSTSRHQKAPISKMLYYTVEGECCPMAKQNDHSLFKSGWNYLTCLFFLKKIFIKKYTFRGRGSPRGGDTSWLNPVLLFQSLDTRMSSWTLFQTLSPVPYASSRSGTLTSSAAVVQSSANRALVE